MRNNTSMISMMFEEIKNLLKSIENRLGEKTILQQDPPAPAVAEPKSGARTSTINPDQFIRLIAAHLQKMEQKTGWIPETVRETEKHVLSKLDELKETVEKQKPDPLVRHYHTIDLKLSKVVITIVSLSILLLASMWGNIRQFEVNFRMKDNDLKYRYIQMTGGISGENLQKIEDLFHYHRDKKKIREIRGQVEGIERKQRQKAAEPKPEE